MPPPAASGMQPLTCPRCGAPLSTSVDGLCAACLMRVGALDLDDPPEPAGEPPAPARMRIGNYDIIDEIARGGMGIVYRARQRGADRIVALKSLLPQLLNVAGMVPRFQQEIEAVARLDHPAILPIYEVGEHAGVPFFSMKLAEGGSLQDRLEAMRGDWQAIASLLAKVAHGIAHAHERGIVHRDIKPGNILFDAHGEPMIGDFGLAKVAALDRQITLVSAAIGSPNYMAPEQISAEFGPVGPATDVYALGAVLYELLTGRMPIAGADVATTMRLVPTQVPESGIHLRPDLPRALDAIALKCLAKQPRDRYAGAAELARDIERWIGGQSVQAVRDKRRRRGLRLASIALAVALVLALATVAWLHWRERATPGIPPPSVAATAPPDRSIAVLPFRNLGSSHDDDYLSSTVTDDMLHDLHQIESLNVVPFRVGNSASEPFVPRNLAERYGVELVLEGDFQHRAKSLQVNARLWSTATGKTVWQHAFETAAGDARQMRAAIADAMISQLQIDIGSDTRARFARDALTRSPAAYTEYLKARYLIRWRRPETLAEAAQRLRTAIALDPGFARAYSALAYDYALWIGAPPAEGPHWPLAVRFAEQALALDPRLGEAHAVLGDYHGIGGRPIEAEKHLREAMRLDPRDPATLHLYTIHLYSVGKLREALDVERRSVALDGTSPQPMMWLAMLTTSLGDPEEARRLWARSDELGAAHPLAAAISRLDLGQTGFLLDWYHSKAPETGIKEPADWPQVLHAAVIDPQQRRPALALLRRQAAQMNTATAILHFGLLGDADAAFKLADHYALGDDFYYHLQLANLWSPRLASLRRDPRFGGLMRRWGFVAYWQKFGPGDFCDLSQSGVHCR